MKHHFADLLDREDNYWTIVPNIDRYSYSVDELIDDKKNAKVVTINKNDNNWKQIFDLPNLQEKSYSYQVLYHDCLFLLLLHFSV